MGGTMDYRELNSKSIEKERRRGHHFELSGQRSRALACKARLGQISFERLKMAAFLGNEDVTKLLSPHSIAAFEIESPINKEQLTRLYERLVTFHPILAIKFSHLLSISASELLHEGNHTQLHALCRDYMTALSSWCEKPTKPNARKTEVLLSRFGELYKDGATLQKAALTKTHYDYFSSALSILYFDENIPRQNSILFRFQLDCLSFCENELHKVILSALARLSSWILTASHLDRRI